MIRNYIQNHRAFAIIASSAVIIHIAVFFTLWTLSSTFPTALNSSSFPIVGGGGDGWEYATLAENMISYKNFSLESGVNGNPETYRAPIYPFFIAIVMFITGSIETVPIFQIILLVISGFLIYRIALSVSPKYKNAGLIAAGLFFFDSTLFYSAMTISTEALYVMFFLFCIFCLVQKSHSLRKSYAIAGLFFGATTLIRPSGIFMIVPIGGFILLKLLSEKNKKEIFAGIFFFGLLFFLTISPWYLRNGLRTGVYRLASVDAYNALNFNVPQYFNYKNGTAIEDIRSSLHSEIGNLSDAEQRDIRNSSLLRKVVLQKMNNNFIRYAFFHISKSANFLLSSGVKSEMSYLQGFWVSGSTGELWHPQTSLVNSILDGRIKDVGRWFYENLIYIPESLFLLAMLVLGIYWSIIEKSNYPKLFLGLIIMLALITGQLSNPRYRIPVLPFIYLSGMAGASVLLNKYKKKPIFSERNNSL